MSYTKVYRLWRNIKSRCFNTKTKTYPNYGGRGITVQKNWINSFVTFYDYVSNLPNYDKVETKGFSLDRIENNGNYEERNLRWADKVLQGRNRRIAPSNTTGYKGVHYVKSSKKFLARITVNKKRITIGYGETPKEAYKLRINYIITNGLEGFEIDLSSYQN